LVLAKLEELNSLKLESINKSFDRYVESISTADKVLDKVSPIEIITQGSSSDDLQATRSDVFKIPWRAVLSSDLHASDVDYDYLSA
jgi:hypothetical protein